MALQAIRFVAAAIGHGPIRLRNAAILQAKYAAFI